MEARGVAPHIGASGATAPADAAAVARALLPLAHAPDESSLRAAAVAAMGALVPLGGFVAVTENRRLRVVGAHDLPRPVIEDVARSDEFRSLISCWRERPVPDTTVRSVAGAPGEVTCAPFFVAETFAGALTLVGPPGAAGTHHDLLAALADHLGVHLGRLHSEGRVDRLEHEADSIVAAAPIPLLVLDPDGALVRANPPACELFGISGSFDAGRSLRGRLGSTELEELVFSSARSGEMDVDVGRPPRRFRATVVQVHDGPRPVARILALADLTTERELRGARDDFVAMVGHELRTPITVIRGFAETLAAHGGSVPRDDHERFLGRIVQQADALHELIEDLLCLSTERDRIGMSLSDVDVVEVATQVVDAQAARHPERTIEVLPLGGATDAVADPARLAQVVRHLVDNAVKYSDGPVRVEIRGGDSVEVAVVDQGDGIFSGDLARLFEPFEQRDRSATRDRGGTGLGLHLCRRLVEMMGGRLDVDTRLGQGSRFWFTVATADRRNQPRPPALPGAAHRSPTRP